MTITLNTKEFDEAILLWLESQGFSTNRFSISTKLTVGRGDLGAGTRMEVTLESKPTVDDYASNMAFLAQHTGVFAAMEVEEPEFPTVPKTGPSFTRSSLHE